MIEVQTAIIPKNTIPQIPDENEKKFFQSLKETGGWSVSSAVNLISELGFFVRVKLYDSAVFSISIGTGHFFVHSTSN